MESIADREKLQRHLDSPRPDPGLFRDLFAAGVRVCSELEERPMVQVEKTDLPQFEDCPACGEPLPQQVGVRFCPFCGRDLRRVACASCGETLMLNWRFCIACGTEVEPQKDPLLPH
jgi:predicted RNA-binding Zn-ribbon protein involved in translation (DUF1610 family)